MIHLLSFQVNALMLELNGLPHQVGDYFHCSDSRCDGVYTSFLSAFSECSGRERKFLLSLQLTSLVCGESMVNQNITAHHLHIMYRSTMIFKGNHNHILQIV